MADTENWDEVMAAVAASATLELEEALTAAYLAAITGPVSKEAVEKARSLAKHAAASLVRDMTKSQLNAIGETLATALQEGVGVDEMVRRLKMVNSLDPNRAKRLDKLREKLERSGASPETVEAALERERKRLLRERREEIASNEARVATSEARDLEAQRHGAKWKHWVASVDERTCPVCMGNVADGVIPMDSMFSGGQRTTPAHPRCRCSIAYVTTERGRELAEKVNKRNQELSEVE